MIEVLKDKKYKSLPTLNTFVSREKDLKLIKKYNDFLKTVPKRTDFISYDFDGVQLLDNKELFKGWIVCSKTSNDTIKVATRGNAKIYFDTADGVIVVNHEKMTDKATYNDLAIFFDGNLKLK